MTGSESVQSADHFNVLRQISIRFAEEYRRF